MKKDIIALFDEEYANFTKSFKKIADYIKFNQSVIAYISINDLAKATKTSPATITRFAKNMGFQGYPFLQEVFQKNLEDETSHMKEIKNAITEIKNSEDGILKKLIEENVDLLSSMNYECIEKQLNIAIDWIEKSRKIYILGARGSYGLAYYLYFMLKEFKENIELLSSGASDFTDKLLHSKDDDVLISISFHPYTNFTCEVSQFFKENGNKIITISDKKDSKLGSLSDIVITAKNSGRAYTFVPTIVILNALIMKLANKNKSEIIDNLTKLKEITDRFNIYSDK